MEEIMFTTSLQMKKAGRQTDTTYTFIIMENQNSRGFLGGLIMDKHFGCGVAVVVVIVSFPRFVRAAIVVLFRIRTQELPPFMCIIKLL